MSERCTILGSQRGSASGRASFILWGDRMEYMTIAEAAAKWNISRRRVQTLCTESRIPGVDRIGATWVIPKDAIKPADARIKSGKYIGFAEKHRRPNQESTNAVGMEEER